MVHRCCISSCKINVRQAEAKGLSYHNFPTNNIQREKWVQAILPHVEKPESFKVVQNYTRICSRHFRNNEYSYDSKKRARLNSTAVPTVFTRKNTTPLVQSIESIKQARIEEIEENPIVLEDALISSANGMSLHSSDQDDLTFESHTSSMRSPSSLEIDKLAYDFRSSLLTNNLPDPLDSLDLSELRFPLPPSLSDEDSIGIDLGDMGNSFMSNMDILTQDLNTYLSTGSSGSGKRAEKRNQTMITTPAPESHEQVTKGGSNKSGNKRGSIPKRKLSSIAKTPKKKDKNFGLFSVERFRDSDKDIEYYTGFPSYSHFEAFFNSLETHVKQLKVTDIMHGVADLIRSQKEEETQGPNSSSSFDGESTTTTTTPDSSDIPETEQKKMLKQGRAMSRIDEFFMTLVRLKRRLPEKIIGHMFLVSQPTVSRVIRAWTMLLFKLFEPIPSTSGIKKKIQHNGLKNKTVQQQKQEEEPSQPELEAAAKKQINHFTKKGYQNCPYSFRQLFRTEVALSIISSAQSPRQSTTTNATATTTSTTTNSVVGMTEGNNNNNKESKQDAIKVDCTEEEDVKLSPICSFPSYSFLEGCEEDVKISFHDSDLLGSSDDLYQSLLVSSVKE